MFSSPERMSDTTEILSREQEPLTHFAHRGGYIHTCVPAVFKSY